MHTSAKGQNVSDVLIHQAIRINTSSRLHFGLLSFGDPRQRQYGGVGVMVDRPGLSLQVESAREFCVEGPLADRIGDFAKRWHDYRRRDRLMKCRLRVLRAPQQDTGLGVGTQLALSVATALDSVSGRAESDLQELARSVGRGVRSSIGTHGFFRGGLLFEFGKLATESLAPVAARVELPPCWRFVQICPSNGAGLSGHAEDTAFGRMPAVPRRVTDRLIEEVQERMLPAARAGQLSEFGESVYQYGRQAGDCFAALQGGPFANPQLESWVKAIRKRGVTGVGQSSWGPSLFVILAGQTVADEFVRWFCADVLKTAADAHFTVSAVDNQGAQVRRTPVGR